MSFSDPPGAPTINGWPPKSIVNVGATLTLTCVAATQGGAVVSFEWYFGTNKLTSTGTKFEKYEITKVDKSHGGTYKCVAINADGRAESTTNTLIVKGNK